MSALHAHAHAITHSHTIILRRQSVVALAETTVALHAPIRILVLVATHIAWEVMTAVVSGMSSALIDREMWQADSSTVLALRCQQPTNSVGG